MIDDLSHLTSLSSLLKTADKRVSSLPPPKVAPLPSDSGLIDLKAIEKRAREERENARVTPMVATVSVGPSTVPIGHDPDFVAFGAASARKKKVLATVAAGVGALVVGIFAVVALSGPVAPPAAAAAKETAPPPALAPAPPPAPIPVATNVVQSTDTLNAAPDETAATQPPSKGHTKAKHKKKHPKGPAMVKVTSTGL